MKPIKQFDITLRLAGFCFEKQHVDLIMSLYDLVQEKEGSATLEDIVQVINENEQKYKPAE